MNYYNEHDPFAAEWLRQLMFAGQIPWGWVDERDIQDVKPSELVNYTQCHFFAGIGGWSYALRLAGWSEDRPVWTGSPPCQPFSAAGKGLGKQDDRHLAPVFLDLVKECKPPVLFGEQVAAATTKDHWLDDLQDALEEEGYATGAVVLPACSVGAPHLRQRLFFVAHHWSRRPEVAIFQSEDGIQKVAEQQANGIRGGSPSSSMADTLSTGWPERGSEPRDRQVTSSSSSDQLANTNNNKGLEGRATLSECSDQRTAWEDCMVVACVDGKYRIIESGTFPLANGVPNRVGKLRGYGNAIVPQVAADVIKAYMDYADT